MSAVRVVNISRGTVVADQAEIAVSFWSRLRGLLGRRGLAEGQAMVIPSDMIHTFFMRFAIDVVFLDCHNRVLHVIVDMRPNRISPFVRHSDIVVELPVGTLERTYTQKGDLLKMA